MDIELEASVGGSAADLLDELKRWKPGAASYSTLILVSFSILPTHDAPNDLWFDFKRLLLSYKSRHQAKIFDLTLADRAILMRLTDFNQVGILSDLKIDMLRLIQQHMSEHFGRIDQSRLLRVVPLKTKLSNAIHFLERYLAPQPKAERSKKLRRLREDDIHRVEEVAKQIGPKAFARAFVRSQRAALIKEDRRPVVTGREYYVAMEALKGHVFPDVELRGAGNRFNQLTVTLDRLLLAAFDEVNPRNLPCSINMNVETVFTRTFEVFLRDSRKNVLNGIAFEFRQADILQNFDEFILARDLIQDRGGEVTVDAVFTETVGIVNLLRLGVPSAKIFWRTGAEDMLQIRFEDVKYLQDYGTKFTLCRVDDEAAIEIGHEVGISDFQGFYIDRLLPPGE